jgi:chromosome segregation ATPase
MLASKDVNEYKSPVRKLVRFFVGSRDGWKTKYAKAKKKCKRLSNQVRAVEKSREEWRSRAEQRDRRIAELEEEVAGLKSSGT